MARYQWDDEPMTFTPYSPGHIQLSRVWFVVLSILAVIGAAFILLVIAGA